MFYYSQNIDKVQREPLVTGLRHLPTRLQIMDQFSSLNAAPAQRAPVLCNFCLYQTEENKSRSNQILLIEGSRRFPFTLPTHLQISLWKQILLVEDGSVLATRPTGLWVLTMHQASGWCLLQGFQSLQLVDEAGPVMTLTFQVGKHHLTNRKTLGTGPSRAGWAGSVCGHPPPSAPEEHLTSRLLWKHMAPAPRP